MSMVIIPIYQNIMLLFRCILQFIFRSVSLFLSLDQTLLRGQIFIYPHYISPNMTFRRHSIIEVKEFVKDPTTDKLQIEIQDCLANSFFQFYDRMASL